MKTRLLDVLDAQVFLREWGEEDAPPILFWHALGDHTGAQMLEAGPVLAGRFGYRILAVDAPGFGGSPRLPDERYQVPALLELARGALGALAIDRVAWMGSSWGASLGVHFTARHPDRVAALALLDGGYIDPTIGEGKSLPEIRRQWREEGPWRFESWEAMDEDARQYLRRWSPAVQEVCRSAYREEDGEIVSIMGPDVYAAAIYGIQETPPSQAHAQLGRTGVPVLLLGSTLPEERAQELAAARERFAQLVPQADVRAVEDAPHFLLEDQPEQAAAAVGEWLRALPYP